LASWADVSSFLHGLGQWVVNFVGDLGSVLWNAGKALMSGLLHGIQDGLGAVKDFVTGIAGKLVSWKGPYDYDLTVLVNNGRALMKGLNAGLGKEFLNVEDAVKKMGPRLEKAFSVNPSVALSATGSHSATPNPYIVSPTSPGSDVAELRKAIEALGETLSASLGESIGGSLDRSSAKQVRLLTTAARKRGAS